MVMIYYIQYVLNLYKAYYEWMDRDNYHVLVNFSKEVKDKIKMHPLIFNDQIIFI